MQTAYPDFNNYNFNGIFMIQIEKMAARQHWFKDYKEYWGGYLLLIIAQAWLTVSQTSWPKVTWFFIFFGAYLIINLAVSFIILLLTWPVRKNLDFSRYVKTLIAFSAVYFLSQLIAFVVSYFQA